MSFSYETTTKSRGFKMATRNRLLVENLIICCLVSTIVSQAQDPDGQCIESRKGLPACNFNNANCYQEPSGSEPAWVYVKDPDSTKNKPVEPTDKGYVYLDPKQSNGGEKRITATISSGIKAICVDFSYATTGKANVPISIYIQDGIYYQPAHRVQANTGGQWKSTSFTCCLPEQNDTRLAIGAISLPDGIPAIDDMDVRRSNMPCENGKLVCYPSPPDQAPLDPVTNRTCPSGAVDTAVPSCEFNSDAQNKLDSCGWEVSSAWQPRQKIDGSGNYDVISATSTWDANLTSGIADDANSFCMDVQFTLLGIKDDLRNAFSVNIVTDIETVIWGESSNYKGKDDSVWKINSFPGILPQGTNRKIQIVTLKEGLQIDFIHIKAFTPPTPPPTEAPEDPLVLFKCPKTSKDLPVPLCGMTAVPSEVPGSGQGWTEELPDDTNKGSFPGKEHYLLYQGTELGLNKTAASVTTPFINISDSSFISYSYALSAKASIEVWAKDDNDREVLVWRKENELKNEWKTVDISVEKSGDVQVSFRILPPENPTDTPVLVAFTDFLVKIEPQAPSATKAPEDPLVVYKCPKTSENLPTPLCGMTAVPTEVPGSGQGWTEELPADTSKGIFPGKEHYLLYRGTELDLTNMAASLTTPNMTIYDSSKISFSYALSGKATIVVWATDEANRAVVVHKVQDDTKNEWKSFEGPIGKTGDVQVSFTILPPEAPTNTTVNVGFADIVARVEPKGKDKDQDKKPGEKQNDNPGKNPDSKDTSPKDNSDNKDADSGKDAKETSNNSRSGSNTGVIVGSIFGVLAGLILIGGAVWFFLFRNRDDSDERGRYVEKLEDGSSEPQHFQNVMYTAGK